MSKSMQQYILSSKVSLKADYPLFKAYLWVSRNNDMSV